MTKAEVIEAPSANGQTDPQAGEAQPRSPKDYTNDELRASRKMLMEESRRIEANINFVNGILVGRGEDVEGL